MYYWVRLCVCGSVSFKSARFVICHITLCVCGHVFYDSACDVTFHIALCACERMSYTCTCVCALVWVLRHVMRFVCKQTSNTILLLNNYTLYKIFMPSNPLAPKMCVGKPFLMCSCLCLVVCLSIMTCDWLLVSVSSLLIGVFDRESRVEMERGDLQDGRDLPDHPDRLQYLVS